MSLQSSLSTEIDLLDDSDEEKEAKKDLLLACVLVGEYLSERKARPTFYVRERIEWEKQIQDLSVEGPEAFQKMYRMEYSTFKKLCDIISPKIVVNDEMSRAKTGKDSITVEIMLHFLLRWLSGGSYLDIRLNAGISLAKFYSRI